MNIRKDLIVALSWDRRYGTSCNHMILLSNNALIHNPLLRKAQDEGGGLAGLAFDFCVRFSAEDAKREGFSVAVVGDASRGIDVNGSIFATRQALAGLGISCIKARA